MVKGKHVVPRCWIIKARPALRKERGSALVLVMFLVLMLTILGMAVMGATIGGAQRTETRENDVQSLHLAQKGLDEASAYIQSQLVGLKDIDPNKLESILAKLNNLQNKAISTKLETASNGGKINSLQYEDGKKVIAPQSRKYFITISASADINGVTRKLEQEVVIDSYPDFLKYAIGTEGTLTINGSPEIAGDIYAGNKLILNKKAEYIFYGKEEKEPTLFPTIKAHNSATTNLQDANIGTGEVHVQSLNNILYTGEDGIEWAINNEESKLADRLMEVLGVQQNKVKIKDKRDFVRINVIESFFDKVAEAVDSSGQTDPRTDLRHAYDEGTLNSWLDLHLTKFHHVGIPVKSEDGVTDEEKKAEEEDYLRELAEFRIAQKNMREISESKVFVGDLSIDNSGYTELNFSDTAKDGIPITSTPPKWLVVTGNLNIENYSSAPLKIRGNILVTGDVKIKGNVAFDSMMYVLGKTTVVDAAIRGLDSKEVVKELVLISKGNVDIYRVDSFKEVNTVAPLNAFFYTDAEATLYGVGSAFLLNGGFFAKGNLTINAVLGSVSEDAATHSLSFENQFTSVSPKLVPRFQVNYNQDIYDHQQTSLPRVQSLNVQFGPVQLVKN